MKDPIVRDGDKWFFKNETWTDLHGPFASRTEAEEMLRKYLEWLSSGDEE